MQHLKITDNPYSMIRVSCTANIWASLSPNVFLFISPNIKLLYLKIRLSDGSNLRMQDDPQFVL